MTAARGAPIYRPLSRRARPSKLFRSGSREMLWTGLPFCRFTPGRGSGGLSGTSVRNPPFISPNGHQQYRTRGGEPESDQRHPYPQVRRAPKEAHRPQRGVGSKRRLARQCLRLAPALELEFDRHPHHQPGHRP